MKIYAPVNDFNGLRNNVRFVNGVGETDNPQLIEWFKTRGYTIESKVLIEAPIEKSVEKCDKPIEKSLEKCDEVEVMGYPEQDFKEMTPNELREWAIENGLGSKIRNTRNKEKLLEIIRG